MCLSVLDCKVFVQFYKFFIPFTYTFISTNGKKIGISHYQHLIKAKNSF